MYFWSDLSCSINANPKFSMPLSSSSNRKNRKKYIIMEDVLASIIMFISNNSLKLCGLDDENVHLEQLSYKFISPRQMCQLTQGKSKSLSTTGVIPSSIFKILSLTLTVERITATWLRGKISCRTSTFCDRVFFCSEVYDHYVRLCQKYGKKPKRKRYILSQIDYLMVTVKVLKKAEGKFGNERAFSTTKSCCNIYANGRV